MSRYYTCAKCDALVKEGENCLTCAASRLNTGKALSILNEAYQGAWLIDPDDANYTDEDDGMGD